MILVVVFDYELRMNFNLGFVDKVEKFFQLLEGDVEQFEVCDDWDFKEVFVIFGGFEVMLKL